MIKPAIPGYAAVRPAALQNLERAPEKDFQRIKRKEKTDQCEKMLRRKDCLLPVAGGKGRYFTP